MLEQQTKSVPVDILRTVMSEIYIGVTENKVPFISEADEIYIFWKGLWYMAEWGEIPAEIEGNIHAAADWMSKHLETAGLGETTGD